MSEKERQLFRKAMEPKSDQLNADDLIGSSKDITITHVSVRASGEQLVSIHYENDNGKPWKPSKGMMRLLAEVWGDDPTAWAGKSVTLYRKDDVKFGRDTVGGIRVSAMSHINKPFKAIVTVSRGKRVEMQINVFGGNQQYQQQQEKQQAPQQNAPTLLQVWAKKIVAARNYGSLAIEELWATVPNPLKPELQDFYNQKYQEAREVDIKNESANTPPDQAQAVEPVPRNDDDARSLLEEF